MIDSMKEALEKGGRGRRRRLEEEEDAAI